MPSDQLDEPMERDHQDLARWTHMWAAAAVSVLERIDTPWDDRDPVGSIGSRDVLALVLLDAVRNTYRGARSILGSASDEVRDFEMAAPDVKPLRDRFEHFDEYLRGDGWGQRSAGAPRVELDGMPGLVISGSRGGGSGGHTIDVKVVEATGEKHYTLETGMAVEAARLLARAAIQSAGLLTPQHLSKCKVCADTTPDSFRERRR